MSENNQMMSVEGQLVGMPLAGPESFSQQQLDYLKRALGVDETVLWDGGSTPAYSVNLTEAASNFERIKILIAPEGTGTNYSSFVEINPNADGKLWDLAVGNGLDNAWIALIKLIASDDYLTLTANRRKSISFGAYTSTSTSLTATSIANPTCILKVIGIHRIAGGNQ